MGKCKPVGDIFKAHSGDGDSMDDWLRKMLDDDDDESTIKPVESDDDFEEWFLREQEGAELEAVDSADSGADMKMSVEEKKEYDATMAKVDKAIKDFPSDKAATEKKVSSPLANTINHRMGLPQSKLERIRKLAANRAKMIANSKAN